MRLALSVAAAFALAAPCAALAEGLLTRVWIDEKAPTAVWGQFSGRSPAPLFGVDVRTADRFTPASGWRLRRFVITALSPDGRRVAFKAAGDGSSAIGVYHLDSGAADILDTACDARELIWSPDGRYLAIEDSQGVLNNSVRVMGYDADASEMEISGDVLSDLGYPQYRFRNQGRASQRDIWRTQVFAARWVSARSLAFKLKRVHLKGGSGEEGKAESWAFDVVSKRFVRN